jgi:hypothetical protein
MTLHTEDRLVSARTEEGRGALCRFDHGDVFAYVERGCEYVRTSDHEVWAIERDDTLVSARSGLPLAVRRGKVFFAFETGEPLYYERAT